MAEGDEVLGCRSRASDIVDLDGAMLGECGRIHEDDRHACPPDLFDLGMVVAEADRHDAVDRRAAERSCQGAVDRGDEVERVPVLLGRQRDPFAEGTEERVREDDAEGLRSEEPDRQRLSLGQHPCDGVGGVAEVLGDLADPARRFRRQPVRAVERERDGRLRYPGFAGNVGDTGASVTLLHSVRAPLGSIERTMVARRAPWGGSGRTRAGLRKPV